LDDVSATVGDDGVLRDSQGRAGVFLVATDSPNVTPTDWTWTVAYRLHDGASRGNFAFKLPGGSVVNLTAATPVSASGGTSIIQGPPGPAGPPGTVDESTLGTPNGDPNTLVRRNAGGEAGFNA